MNHRFDWQDDWMVHDEWGAFHEMQEVNRAVAEARLLREAGLSGPSLLTRVTKALRTWLTARREKVRDHHSSGAESYEPTVEN